MSNPSLQYGSSSVSLSGSVVNGILNEWITSGKVEKAFATDRPLLDRLKKKEGGGRSFVTAVTFSPGNSGAATFSQAWRNKSAPRVARFSITTQSFFNVQTIGGDLLAASTPAGAKALATALDLAMQNGVDAVADSVATALYGSGSGSRGVYGTKTDSVDITDLGIVDSAGTSVTTGFTVVMSSVPDSANLHLGDILQSIDSGGVIATDNAQVVALNLGTGLVTLFACDSSGVVTGAPGVPVGWANGEALYVSGDLNEMMPGLAYWIPSTAPAYSDNAYGVNRSVAPSNLAGVRVSGSGTIAERLIDGVAQGKQQTGARPTAIFMNPLTHAALQKDLGAKVQFVNNGAGNRQVFGSNAVFVSTGAGELPVFGDRFCPRGVAYALDEKVLELTTFNGLPRVFDYGTGNRLNIVNDQDAVQLRIGGYGALVNHDPSKHIRIAMPTVG